MTLINLNRQNEDGVELEDFWGYTSLKEAPKLDSTTCRKRPIKIKWASGNIEIFDKKFFFHVQFERFFRQCVLLKSVSARFHPHSAIFLDKPCG